MGTQAVYTAAACSESFAAHLAEIFGVCATCAPLWAAWYVRGRNPQCVRTRAACLARNARSTPCAPYVPAPSVLRTE